MFYEKRTTGAVFRAKLKNFFLVGYSRIYLGVHYPGDILGGAILGALLAKGIFLILTSVKSLHLKE